ncbi:MAG: zinc ribbon domain-containing protein [Sedimentisphaerales bacterium]|nr:zinc ribbon domain-containing protein [Sedimentisphaerales bacterium]
MVESRTDAMSTATSLAKPLIRPITLCPYCDHVSPEGSKFCGACGAALHLMPCPHCGAVNDITVVTACYRCHSDLHENATVVLPPPAPAITF